ncbi:MAG: outer membrane protein [Allosphingosinicella sp.]
MQYSKVAVGRRGRAMRTVLAGALLAGGLAFGASPAAASDDTPFQGFRIEAITGYDDVGVDFDDDVYNGGKNSQSGFMYGLGVGYDFQAGALVFGVEGEWSDSTASRTDDFSGTRVTNPIAGVPTPVTTHLESKAGADFYVGGRVGYVVSPEAMIYLKAGYSSGKIEMDGSGKDNGVAYTFDEKVSVHGFRLGIGGEYRFSENFYGKAEYRYTNYNNGDLDIRGANVNLNPLFSGIDVVRHQFVIGAGFRF